MITRIFSFIFILTVIAGTGVWTSCGGDGGSNVNNNFPSVPTDPVPVTDAIEPDNSQQTVDIPPGEGDQNAAIGEIEPVSPPSSVLCVIIDPQAGDEADLEVCEESQANPNADSPNGICPEADRETRCASVNLGSGPDFCQVTGDQEYVFVILNLTNEDSFVAYQVIDVTGLPTQSCADLNITENTITSDDN